MAVKVKVCVCSVMNELIYKLEHCIKKYLGCFNPSFIVSVAKNDNIIETTTRGLQCIYISPS